MYGVHHEGPFSGKLVRALCQFVHNMAAESKDENCMIIVTEVGGRDELNHHIPHWKLLPCPEDLWCIKSLKNEGTNNKFHELTKTPPTRALFVDPRENQNPPHVLGDKSIHLSWWGVFSSSFHIGDTKSQDIHNFGATPHFGVLLSNSLLVLNDSDYSVTMVVQTLFLHLSNHNSTDEASAVID
ncbi:hypothetical protein VNO80_29968 [Phaseolus coccineus]|uniref:Uncharacterized protein n=1 Tax=Phaseolus coccineus TaxID=3886 RepID=A0AAN9LGY3_PHACN